MADVLDFEILALVLRRRQSGQRQQPQARQRGDRLAALDETRQGQAESQQLGVTRADAAHGNQADFHPSTPQ